MAKAASTRDGSKSKAIEDYLKTSPDVTAKTVVEELAKQGVTVSLGLVNKVKYSKPTGEAKVRKATGGARRGRRPASEGAPNMSDVIRKYMDDHPTATRPEIRDALNAQGVSVKTSLVNAVFIKVRGKGASPAPRGRRGRKPAAAAAPAAAPVAKAAAAAASPSGAVTAADLISAKQLASQLGGIDRLRNALAVLEALQ